MYTVQHYITNDCKLVSLTEYENTELLYHITHTLYIMDDKISTKFPTTPTHRHT